MDNTTLQDKHTKLKAILAVLSFIASVVFAGFGFFSVPIGIISPSVLIYTAEMLLFCCMLLGFSSTDNQVLKEVMELVKEVRNDLK